MLCRSLIVLSLFLLPNILFADVVITEIMYDLEGTDSGREWIEVFNDSSSDINLESWYFFEANTNHSLTSVKGSSVLSPGGYAVIVSDPDKFLADHPGFSGSIFDSSFSLSNDSETVSIRNTNKDDVDIVSYSSSWGANGNGYSLQNDGSWSEASPTPGEGFDGGGVVSTYNNEDQDDENESEDNSGGGSNQEPDNVSSLRIRTDPQTLVVGIPIKFEADCKTNKGALIRYGWNFGDGTTDEGREPEHIYDYPGTYVVKVYAKPRNQEKIYTQRNIRVLENPVSISDVTFGQDGKITLLNQASSDIDISKWQIKVNGSVFVFPDLTYIAARGNLAITSNVLGFQFYEYPVLMTPEGKEILKKPKLLKKSSQNVNKTSPIKVEVQDDKGDLRNESTKELKKLDKVASVSASNESDLMWPFLVASIAGISVLGIFVIPSKKESGPLNADDVLSSDDFDIKEL